MRSTKNFFIIGLLIFSSLFVGKVSAEMDKQEAETKPIVLAQINVQDIKIISQEENTLNISFNINNREGAQTGVKYGVRVTTQVDNKQKIVDEYVYDEELSVGENITIEKNIVYTAPAGLEGKYNIYVSVKNYSGLPLGSSKAGEVTFLAKPKMVEIIEETCTSTISGEKKLTSSVSSIMTITKNDRITYSCVVKNNIKETIQVIPVFETHLISLYGEKAPEIPAGDTKIVLRPTEEKIIDFLIPQREIPQSYITKIFVKGENLISNSILASYTVSGLSATIQNVSLDKNSYKANEVAKMAFFWTSSATNREELTSISLKADIVNKNKRSCIDNPINTQMAGVGFIEIPITINRSCDNPEVSIALLDATGKILDQKALIFETNEKFNLFNGSTGIIAISVIVLLIIASLIIYFKNLKKKDYNDNHPKSGHIEGAMLTIFFALLISFLPGGLVRADTFFITEQGNLETSYDLQVGSDALIVLNINLDKYVYTYPEDPYIYLTTEAYVMNDDYAYLTELEAYVEYGGFNWIALNQTIYPELNGPYFEETWIDFVDGVEDAQELYVRGNAVFPQSQIIFPFGIDFETSLPYVLLRSDPPVEPTVTVYATNANTAEKTSDYLTVNAGTPIDITWDVLNSQGATYYCHISTGGSCGTSIGDVMGHDGGRYYPIATTTYIGNDQP
jgi:hypothetical protein